MLNAPQRVSVRDWVNGLGRVEKTPTVLEPFPYFEQRKITNLVLTRFMGRGQGLHRARRGAFAIGSGERETGWEQPACSPCCAICAI
jgi:hypothetical protein